MLDRKWIIENEALAKSNLLKRGEDFGTQIEDLVAIEKKRVNLLQEVEQLRFERNQIQVEFRKGPTDELKEQSKILSVRLKDLEETLKQQDEETQNRLLALPNILHQEVPCGSTSDENVEVARDEKGLNSRKHITSVPHFQLQGKTHQIDFEHATKISGARFSSLKGDFARLERALINFMLDTHRGHGYTEMMVPYMVNYTSMLSSGQFPKMEEDAFKVQDRDLYLIPTAEVSLINHFQNQVLEEKELDVSLVAFSPCFRAEAGSYGVDTRGLIRLHQFHKIELVKVVHPDRSYEAFEQIVADARRVLDLLELPYRVMLLCSGDIGFSSSLTYDLEVWVQSQKTYREISSVSNCGDFQARRAKIRYRPKSGNDKKKTSFVHTLNGSGLAVGRTLLALSEYYQDGEGRIAIPEVLQPYLGGQKVIEWDAE